jgi:hypothetical protein
MRIRRRQTGGLIAELKLAPALFVITVGSSAWPGYSKLVYRVGLGIQRSDALA